MATSWLKEYWPIILTIAFPLSFAASLYYHTMWPFLTDVLLILLYVF